MNNENPCTKDKLCNYNILESTCETDYQCVYGSCQCSLCGRFFCGLPQNYLVRKPPIQSSQSKLRIFYELCDDTSYYYNNSLLGTANICENVMTASLIENKPQKIVEGYSQDPILVKFTTDGDKIQLCFSFLEMKNSGLMCKYYCFVTEAFLFSYYFMDCDDSENCITNTKVLKLWYSADQNSINVSESTKNYPFINISFLVLFSLLVIF